MSETAETVTYWMSHDSESWWLCYEDFVPQALAEGYAVKRITKSSTWKTEYFTDAGHFE